MSTRNPSRAERIARLFASLSALGFTHEESAQLRRIEMTLHRWAELECGDGNDFASWAIERDEQSGLPYLVTYPHDGKPRRTRVADREKGALKRLGKIIAARNSREPSVSPAGAAFGLSHDVLAYHQTDPRGCALYIVKANDLPLGGSIESFYTRGLAVAA
jgi:hypothetical protein